MLNAKDDDDNDDFVVAVDEDDELIGGADELAGIKVDDEELGPEVAAKDTEVVDVGITGLPDEQ